MKTLVILAVVLLALVLFVSIWVRVAPSDADDWHVSPSEAPEPGDKGVRMVDGNAPRFDASRDDVMSALLSLAEGKPQVSVLARSSDPDRVTFIARTKWMRFPDYVTFEAVPDNGGTRLNILSRARFGRSDLGVNSARVDRWIAQLGNALRQDG